MHRTERHDVYVANGSRGSRTEVRVTTVNGSTTSSSSDAQDPKPGVSKFGVRKVAYRRKAPITLGSVKDWPVETPSQPEDNSQYGRIDLSKMTIESSSKSGTKVHKINVETSSGGPIDNKSPLFKGITVRTGPSQENRKPLLSPSKTSTPQSSSIKDSSQPSLVNKTQNASPIKVVPVQSSLIPTKTPSDIQKTSASNIREKPKVSSDLSNKSEAPSSYSKELPKSPQTPQKPATSSSTPARANYSQSPIPSKEMPKSHDIPKDPPKSPTIATDSKLSPNLTKGVSKGSLSPSRDVPAARDNKAPSLSPSRDVPAARDNKAPSLSPSKDAPAARDKKAPFTLPPTQKEPPKAPSPARSQLSPCKDKTRSSPLPQRPSGSQPSSTKTDAVASTKKTSPISPQHGGSANTSKIPKEVASPKEPALRKQTSSSNLPKITFQTEASEPEFKARNVVIKENKPVKQWYSVDETLGSGKFGVVRLGRDKETNTKCAIKFIPIGSEEERESVLTEIKVMVKLQHPRLIQLLDAFMSKDEAALVMEVISGGELFERIIDDNFELTESKCVQFMREVCEGVKFIHEQHVIHLDLKPENILCLNRTGFKIKIIDFGLARFWKVGEPLRVMFGTPEFVAPEILAYDEVSHLTDMWSVGVICYVLLSGLSPFMGDSDRETYINITKAKFSFDYPEFKEISADAKNFVTQLLVKDMKRRMTADEALNHRWLQKRTSLKRTGTVSKRQLRRFVYRRKWQKAKNIIVALLRMGVTLTQR